MKKNTTTRPLTSTVLTAAFAAMLAGHALAQDLALDGNDPTSYFGSTGPAAGEASVEVEAEGVTFRFTDASAKRAFEANAERFEPVFGGHDPVALAAGKQVLGDPDVFSVVGERLFLFEDPAARVAFLKSPGRVASGAVKAYAEVTGEDESDRLAAVVERKSGEHNLEKSLAVSGYDPVGYFPEGGGKPQKGRAEFSVTFDGAVFRFVNRRNRDRFVENPTRYEPAHGGWCSYAASQESYAEIDPKKYLIEDGRLLLFYNGVFNDTRKKWLKSDESLLPAADDFWLDETGETPRRG
ncbi:MAG: YHS domain-containing (seleno)protein [Planctomycetota bacterium]